MSASLWFQNLLAYSLQVAVLAAAGLALPPALRLRQPRVLYHYLQALLAACLILPWLEPWRPLPAATGGSVVSRLLLVSGPPGRPPSASPLLPVLLGTLVAGVALRLIWLALGLAKLQQYVKGAQPLDAMPSGVRDIAARLGVPPRIGLSDDLPGPVTFGFWNPLVLLPPSFTGMDSTRQRLIAGHELLHVARRDWIVNLAEEVALTALWFHPAVWWLVGRIRLCREQVVDQQVVKLTGALKPYLYALVEMAAGPGTVRGLMAPAFLHESQLAERIRTLTKEDRMSKRRITLSLGCVLVLVLLTGIAVVRRFPLNAAAAPIFAASPAASDAHVYDIGNGVSAPVLVWKSDPGYTPEAKAAGIAGVVILRAVIGADGNVLDVSIIRPLDKGLDKNAVNTVKTWKFKAAMKDGKPVACKVMIEVAFRVS